MKAAKHRIYLVVSTVSVSDSLTTSTRLVRARSRAAAYAHVAQDTINVTLPDQDAFAQALGAGVRIEDAKEDGAAAGAGGAA